VKAEKGIIEAEPGSKTQGVMVVGSDPLGEISIPVWIAAGRAPGERIVITAGVHGSEYDSIRAAVKLFNDINPETISGTVIVVPIVNPVAFAQAARYVCPIDDVNLNRIFPGSSDGTISYRIAQKVFSEIVLTCRYLVDLHGGDIFESLVSHTKYCVTGTESVDREARELAMLFSDGLFQPVDGGPGSRGGGLFSEAAKAGVVSILAEAGGEGKIAKVNTDYHMSGLYNVLSHIGILDREVEVQKTYREVTGVYRLVADFGGLFVPEVSIGDELCEGQLVGSVESTTGTILEEIQSPVHGLMMMLFTNGVVNTGDPLGVIWTTKETAFKGQE